MQYFLCKPVKYLILETISETFKTGISSTYKLFGH